MIGDQEMRRYKKKRLMEEFLLFAENHRQIEQAFLKGNYNKVQSLLVQCQEMAILAGDMLEQDTAPHKDAVKSLEEYCEIVYEMAVKTSKYGKQLKYNEAKHIMQPIRRGMDRCINQVKEYVKNKVEEKIEAAFFPYKASMWDSLESVWMAAEADKDCDAYVVPIPYFDKHQDGTVMAMHYEGDELPEYVSIVDWEDYDVEEHHPDVIYIHNPYDNTNKVTTVHPDFYAKVLKKYTELLVYIPYFVCMDDSVPEHLCVQPGTMYADKVIVQSEKAREVYINEFHKFEEENNCKGYFGCAEEKFLALGSPKYDKVLSTTRENVKIPSDWIEKMEGEDGEKKKVILYNTSLVVLLKEKEKALQKIRSVLKLIKDRKDVVLLWRPHPFSKETCEAMRPDLLEQYYEIVELYRNENWGIYDDTSELHRAIAISDAYYGDPSSLVELYRLTGKPIMIQDVNIV